MLETWRGRGRGAKKIGESNNFFLSFSLKVGGENSKNEGKG